MYQDGEKVHSWAIATTWSSCISRYLIWQRESNMPLIDLVEHKHLVDKSTVFQLVPTQRINHWGDFFFLFSLNILLVYTLILNYTSELRIENYAIYLIYAEHRTSKLRDTSKQYALHTSTYYNTTIFV